MTSKEFFAAFGHIAEAPEGVKKLRELILQLAVQGKLVPQDPNDEPASALYSRIRQRIESLIKKGQMRESKKPAKISFENPEIPKTWRYTSLYELGEIAPRNDLADELEVSFVPMGLISEKLGIPVITSEIRAWKEIKSGFTHFAEGDVCLAKITPCFQNGKSAVMYGLKNDAGAGTTELHVFRGFSDLLCPEYVLIFLKTPAFIQDGIPHMTGTAGQKRITRDYFAGKPFPLPPLAEQKRIVAKVEELMALCDELEEKQTKRDEARARLNVSALHELLSAADPETFAAHWWRICQNFDLLYNHPETITKLRAAILQLAVQGKLVPQDPNDEKIALDESVMNEINIGEEPFVVPKSWRWCFLDDVSIKITDGEHITPRRSQNGYFLLSARNITNNGINISNVDYVPFDEFIRIRKRCDPNKGDILLSCSGSVGRVAIVDEDDKYVMVRSAAMVRIINEYVFSAYIALALKSPVAQDQIIEKSKSTAQSNLFLGKIKQILIPLPPLAEQKRIVAKVDQLMALCDELENKLTASRQTAQKLAASTIHHFTTA